MDNTVTDQTSVLRFIEDNWLNGERIAGSFDAYANSIVQMFDFKHRRTETTRCFWILSAGSRSSPLGLSPILEAGRILTALTYASRHGEIASPCLQSCLSILAVTVSSVRILLFRTLET